MSERFWSKVDRSGECWEWTAALARGRPHCRYDGRTMPGRKASWLIANGPVPKGAVVRGTCGNQLCVRPDHLELSTKAEMARRNHPGREYDFSSSDRQRMAEMYRACRSCEEIAPEFGCSPALIHKTLVEMGVEMRSVNFKRKGLHFHTHGYPKIGSSYVHRIVAEAWYRPLREGEHVHHKDGDKLNNHPDNLEILPASEHHRLHYEERGTDAIGRFA